MNASLYRHRKTGRVYEFITVASVEKSPEEEVVVYRGSNGRAWTRPREEFFERFERIIVESR